MKICEQLEILETKVYPDGSVCFKCHPVCEKEATHWVYQSYNEYCPDHCPGDCDSQEEHE